MRAAADAAADLKQQRGLAGLRAPEVRLELFVGESAEGGGSEIVDSDTDCVTCCFDSAVARCCLVPLVIVRESLKCRLHDLAALFRSDLPFIVGCHSRIYELNPKPSHIITCPSIQRV